MKAQKTSGNNFVVTELTTEDLRNILSIASATGNAVRYATNHMLDKIGFEEINKNDKLREKFNTLDEIAKRLQGVGYMALSLEDEQIYSALDEIHFLGFNESLTEFGIESVLKSQVEFKTTL